MHVARMRERSAYRILAEGRRPLGNPSADCRIILKWILEKWFGGEGEGLDRSGSGEGQAAGSCECGNEFLD